MEKESKIEPKNPIVCQVIDLAKHYTNATGVGCYVSDATGEQLFSSIAQGTGCHICQKVRNDTNFTPSCQEIHRENSLKAYRYEGFFIYSCPANFIFWAAPIVVEKKIIATIMAGSARLKSHNEYLETDYKQYFFDAKETPNIEECLNTVIQLNDNRIESLVKLLIFLCQSFSDERNLVQHQSQLLREKISILSYNNELEDALVTAIHSGNQAKADEIFEEIKALIFNEQLYTFSETKNKVLCLAILLAHLQHEVTYQQNNAFDINLIHLKIVQTFQSLPEIKLWLDEVIESFRSKVFYFGHLKHGPFLAKAIHYIHQNFAEEITLEDVAEVASLSPSYFSRIFKKELNRNFTEYLNHIRVEESKSLLRTSNASLSEIALQCGFSDQSYYTKIFKKSAQISPGRFRQQYLTV